MPAQLRLIGGREHEPNERQKYANADVSAEQNARDRIGTAVQENTGHATHNQCDQQAKMGLNMTFHGWARPNRLNNYDAVTEAALQRL